MEPARIIKGLDVVEDGAAGFGTSDETATEDGLVFQAAPEGFDEGVVVAVALAAHGGDQAVSGEFLPIGVAGKLGAAIRVDDQRGTRQEFAQPKMQGSEDESGEEALAQRPADDAALVYVEHGDEE